jgi:integrase
MTFPEGLEGSVRTLARLGDALRETRIDPFAAAAIRLLILTGARLREILDAQWPHVDIECGVIFLPDSKSGKKPVYLSAAALEVLAGLSRIQGTPYIIPGEKAGQPKADLKKPWAAICKAAGLEGVRLHALRHSFRQHRRGRVHGPACHRKATRALSGRHHASLCPF